MINEDDTTASVNPIKDETQDTESRENVGLRFDPSLPDPLRYTGASFRSIANLVPEDAWKSTNKDDKFKFDVTRNFDGSKIDTADGFSITGKSKSKANATVLVSRKTDYDLIVLVEGTGLPVGDLQLQIITISGVEDKPFTIQKETGPGDLIKESEASGRFQRFFKYIFSDRDDVGRITGVSFTLSTPRPEGTLNAPGFEDAVISSIEITKKNEDVSTKVSTTIPINRKLSDGGVFSGKVTDPTPVDESPNDEGVSVGSDEVGSDSSKPVDEVLSNDEEPIFSSSYEFQPPTDTGATTNGVSDTFGFNQKTYASANFEVSLTGFEIQQNITKDGSIANIKVPSTFGLLAREAPVSPKKPALSESFCLFVEPRGLGGSSVRSSGNPFAVYTSKNGEAKENEFQLTSIKNTDELKITRESGIFRGYYNDFLIGEEEMKSKVDVNNEELVTEQAKEERDAKERAEDGETSGPAPLVSRLGEKKKLNFFQLGVVTFAPSSSSVNVDNKTFHLSSKVRFSSNPTIVLKDRQLAVVELYNLSLFYGRYGLGRTINTFTLLPGESTKIELTSTRSSRSTSEQKTNVFEKVDASSKSELETSVETENSKSSEQSSDKSASVSASASGGFFGVSFSASASASTSKSSSQSELARSVSGAVANQANEYSSERTIEANSTTTTDDQQTDSNSVARNLVNLNNNRTLNFVFRQLNQEFLSVLHLVDIQLGFFGPDDNIKATGIDGAKAFIERYVKQASVLQVYNKFIKNVRFVDDYEKNRVDVLVRNVAPPFDKPFKTINLLAGEDIAVDDPPENFGASEKESTIAFNSAELEENNELIIADDLNPIKGIPGVIIKVDRYVVRTEGIATEAILGQGDALDDYGIELQQEDIKNQKAKTRIVEAKADLLLLQKDIMNATDNEGVRIKYLKYFNFLEDGKQGSSFSTRSDGDNLFWLWLSKAWTVPVFRIGISFCFMMVIYFSLFYMFTLPRH